VIDGQEILALQAGLIVGALRTIGAILRAAASLDGE
jgi:hypothetical protein